MPELAVRFGVMDRLGNRAETWKCWTRTGLGKRDVYLSCRALRGNLKLSLHESGRWHISFDPSKFETMFRKEDKPPTRFVQNWREPPPIESGLLLAVRIQVPLEAVNIPSGVPEPNVCWIEAPQEEQMVETAVFMSDSRLPYTTDDWPGRAHMHASFVGGFPLDGGGGVWVVSRHTPCTYPKHGPIQRRRYCSGADPDKVLREYETYRSLVWGDCEDGSVGVFECPVPIDTVKRSGPTEQG